MYQKHLTRGIASQTILLNPKLLVINYNKNNSFFSKIIGYNRIKIK